MPRIKSVLWDLDDTLVPTTITRHQAQQSMIDAVLASLPSSSETSSSQAFEMIERLVYLFGSSYYVKHISLLCSELTAASDIQQKLIETGYRTYRQVFWQLAPVEGAVQTLDLLRGQGLRLGLISNGLFPLQMQKLMHTRLKPFFDPDLIFISSHFYRQNNLPPINGEYDQEELTTSSELEIAWLKTGIEKPWPLMFDVALEHCNCPANQVIYVGNRISDIVPARLAGMWSVRVSAHSAIEAAALLSFERPDYTIDNVTDIFSVIHQIEKQ